MYKQHLINSLEKEIQIVCRLLSKVPDDQFSFRPKEGMRSLLELVQYLTVIGIAMPSFWLQSEPVDFRAFFGERIVASKNLLSTDILPAMQQQLQEAKMLFASITDDELLNKEISYPWGGTDALGQGIINTSIKFFTGYKLQLFLYLKLCTDLPLGTADAWVLTDL